MAAPRGQLAIYLSLSDDNKKDLERYVLLCESSACSVESTMLMSHQTFADS